MRNVFDAKGFPIFDDVAKVEVRIPVDEFRGIDYRQQMAASTEILKQLIIKNEIPESTFTSNQLTEIMKGKATFEGYTWHHHQDTGRMHLVPRKIHRSVGHIGWDALKDGV